MGEEPYIGLSGFGPFPNKIYFMIADMDHTSFGQLIEREFTSLDGS